MTTAIDETIWQHPAVAGRYLAGVSAHVPLAAEQLDVAMRVIRGALGERGCGRVLDLGCGDGVFAAAVLDAYPEAHAVLVDFSEPMLDAARQRFAGNNRVRVARVDYADPAWTKAAGFEPGSFDAVVSRFAIHHQADPAKMWLYGQVFELLRPGGVFVNVEHVASRDAFGERLWIDALTDSLHDGLNAAGEPISREEVTQRYVHGDDVKANKLAGVEAQCRWLRAIGFGNVDCFAKIFELAVFGGVKPA